MKYWRWASQGCKSVVGGEVVFAVDVAIDVVVVVAFGVSNPVPVDVVVSVSPVEVLGRMRDWSLVTSNCWPSR